MAWVTGYRPINNCGSTIATRSAPAASVRRAIEHLVATGELRSHRGGSGSPATPRLTHATVAHLVAHASRAPARRPEPGPWPPSPAASWHHPSTHTQSAASNRIRTTVIRSRPSEPPLPSRKVEERATARPSSSSDASSSRYRVTPARAIAVVVRDPQMSSGCLRNATGRFRPGPRPSSDGKNSRKRSLPPLHTSPQRRAPHRCGVSPKVAGLAITFRL